MTSLKNIDDNECFKWSIVRYLNPTDNNPRRITKVDKYFAKKLDFKDIKFPVKIRDIYKIEKNSSTTLEFLTMKIEKKIQSLCQKNVVK